MKAIDKKYNEISDEIVYKGDFTDIFLPLLKNTLQDMEMEMYMQIINLEINS